MEPINKLAAQLRTATTQIIGKYDVAYEAVGECEKKIQDLLHKLELTDKTYKERAKTATELANVQKERRYWKDITKVYGNVVEFYRQNRTIISGFLNSAEHTKNIEESLKYRKYTPKAKN